jgi:hypothetical protein
MCNESFNEEILALNEVNQPPSTGAAVLPVACGR